MIRDPIGRPYEECEVKGCKNFAVWWTEDGQHGYCEEHKNFSK